jgi:hypothetical protein
MSKKTLVLAVAAAWCAAVPATASAAPKQLPNCASKGSKTLAASKDGRVLRIGPRVFACHFKRNQRYLLGYAKECQNQTRVGDFRFGNGLLGFVQTNCGLVSGQSDVVVIELKTGRIQWMGPPVGEVPDFRGEYSLSIASWEMKPNGSIAWIGHIGNFVTTPDSGPAPPENYEVWKSDQGRRTKLDDGADIVPGSLALGSRSDTAGRAPIYWQKGTSVFSGTLK